MFSVKAENREVHLFINYFNDIQLQWAGFPYLCDSAAAFRNDGAARGGSISDHRGPFAARALWTFEGAFGGEPHAGTTLKRNRNFPFLPRLFSEVACRRRLMPC